MTNKDIVKALNEDMCNECEYYGEPCGCNRDGGQCKAYGIALEAADAIERLIADVERLTRERDAAVRDMRGNACLACAHYEQKDGQHECFRCENRSKFSWRGVCAENGGKDG